MTRTAIRRARRLTGRALPGRPWLPCLLGSLLAAASARAEGVPGLVGGVGDDLTIEYLYDLRTFESLPEWPRFYFSDDDGGLLPPGDDANPCTVEAPCLSAQRMEDLLSQHGVIVVLDNGTDADPGTWDDATDEIAGWDGFQWDNVGCGPDATGMTDDPCAFLVPLDPDGPQYRFNCEAHSGSLDMTHWLRTSGNGSGYLGIAGAHVRRCPEDADGRNFDEFNVEIANLAGANGNLVLVNSDFKIAGGTHNHPIRVNGRPPDRGHLVMISTAVGFEDFANYDSDCSGSSCAPNRCSAEAVPYDCCKDQGGGVVECHGATHALEINTDGVTVISEKIWEIANTHFEDAGTHPGSGAGRPIHLLNECRRADCNLTVIGPGFEIAPIFSGSGAIGVGGTGGVYQLANADPGTSHDSFYARIAMHGFPDPAGLYEHPGFYFANQADGNDQPATTMLFQNTVYAATHGVRLGAPADNDTHHLTVRCNVFEELHETAGKALVWEVAGSGDGIATFDADGTNVYDTDDGNYSFRFGNVFYQNAQEVDRADPALDLPIKGFVRYLIGPDWFGSTAGASSGPGESGNAAEDCGGDSCGSDGNVFDDGRRDLSAQLICVPGQACEDLCAGHTATRSFDPHAFIPSAVTRANVPITGLTLGTHFHQAGARSLQGAPDVPALAPLALVIAAALLTGTALRARRR